MLGKRKKQIAYPKQWDAKRKKTANQQFGPGYNPKQVSYRKPPPNAELKWFDKTSVQNGWNAAGGGMPSNLTTTTLVDIAAGDDGYNRNGNKIMVRKLTIRGACELDQNDSATFTSTTPGEVWFRWLIIIDTQANGGIPALTDVFEEDPTSGDSYDLYNSLKEAGRYKVIMDKYIKVNQAHPMYNTTSGHTHVANRVTHFKKTINLNLPIHYTGGQGAVGQVRNNNIFMVVFNGHDGTHCRVNWRTRVRFTDY